jgi:cobalt-zinc-cadmium efflux system membrane fusion protein
MRRLLLLALPLLAACHAAPTEQVETTAPVPVTLQTAHRGTIRRVISATGTVKPATGAELVVTAPQAARIAEMPKGVGDRVRRGDLLVRFEIPALEADAASRRADALRAQSRLTLAKASFERVQGLFQRGIAARKEVEDARRELTDAEAGVGETQTSQATAAKLAARAVVRAPFAGVIADRAHNPGDLLESSAEVLLRLIDPARLQVEAAVPVDQLETIAVGNPARVRGPGGTPFAARVIARPPAVDPATSSASIRLEFTQGTSLPAGTPVQVEIGGEEHQDAVIVPAAAVVQQGPETFIYTVDAQSHAHQVKVRIGIATSAEAEVVSGVTAGTRVIVEGQNGLPDGAAVVPDKEAQQPAEKQP